MATSTTTLSNTSQNSLLVLHRVKQQTTIIKREMSSISPCVLYQNPSATVTLIDVPRSIEQAQGFSSSSSLRLISSSPLGDSFASLEPKSAKAKANLEQVPLQALLLQKHLEFALEEVKADRENIWCLPRHTADEYDGEESSSALKSRKRRRLSPGEEEASQVAEDDHVLIPDGDMHFHNSKPASLKVKLGSETQTAFIPPRSTFVRGEMHETMDIFKTLAPKFNVIVLDPPWPNRSARRKQTYSISYGNPEIRSLLSSIPLYDHIQDQGLIAVWVTNKPAFHEMLLGQGGLFEVWGVELVEEWIWLKVTNEGEPICALDSTWKKPYEILLVGRRGGKQGHDVKRRVVIGVPDLHSRKPSSKVLFEQALDMKEGEYQGLEIFARNLTSGWWSWGNEVLKFQTEEHWAEP
jgi:N6-adenosine-specific RNA methylase IME4